MSGAEREWFESDSLRHRDLQRLAVSEWAQPIDRYTRKELEVAGLIEFVAALACVDLP